MATDWIGKLKNLNSIRPENLRQAVTKLVLLPFVAFFLSTANLIEALFQFVINPLTSFSTGLADFASALLSGPAGILSAGAQASQTGVRPFGILGFLVAMAVVLGGAYMLAKYASIPETSDWLPFTLGDLPGPFGADEEEQ